jgi:uncharacterized protein
LIAYFDTSAVVPLLINEAGTERCEEQWSVADRVVSVRLVEVEARAALAQAVRLDRLTASQLRQATASLTTLLQRVDFVEVSPRLVARAGDLAENHALRAYDAVHLAAAVEIGDDDTVLVAGDQALLRAAAVVGLTTAST